jgi:hypothetical protein
MTNLASQNAVNTNISPRTDFFQNEQEFPALSATTTPATGVTSYRDRMQPPSASVVLNQHETVLPATATTYPNLSENVPLYETSTTTPSYALPSHSVEPTSSSSTLRTSGTVSMTSYESYANPAHVSTSSPPPPSTSPAPSASLKSTVRSLSLPFSFSFFLSFYLSLSLSLTYSLKGYLWYHPTIDFFFDLSIAIII